MSNLIPIWTPQDAVDTAEQFHRELANAERGVPDRFPFSRSRFGKARRLDALAVGLLMLVMALIGMLMLIAFTPTVKAAPQDDAYSFAAVYGPVVCQVLDDFPSVSGIVGIGQALGEQGWSGTDVGRIIAYSAAEFCPRHMPLLRRFADSYGHQTQGQVA